MLPLTAIAVAQKDHFFYQLFHFADEMGRYQNRLLPGAELTQQGLQDARRDGGSIRPSGSSMSTSSLGREKAATTFSRAR